MLRNDRLRSALLALAGLAALVTTACTDGTRSPVGPGAASAERTAGDASLARRARTVVVADLQLSSDIIILNGAATRYTVVIRNPTDGDVGNVYVQGFLQAGGKRDWISGGASPATCAVSNATVPAGADCTMSGDIATSTNLPLGPGTFTLKVVQLQPSGQSKVLDSRTVDVRIGWQTPL
jgi:hypothetical protein